MPCSKNKSIVLALAAIVIVIAIIGIFKRSRHSVVRLPDGSEVSIRQVTFGKTHKLIAGRTWQRMLAGLPTNITARLGIRERIDRTKDDTLVVWLQWYNPTNTSPAPYPEYLRVVDTNGLASATMFVEGTMYNFSNHITLMSFYARSFPRDQPTLLLELRMYEPPGNTPVRKLTHMRERHLANFRIKNPALTKRAALSQQTWPTTVLVEGEPFTLLGINSGLSATGTMAALCLDDQWTELTFRIGTNEPAQRNTNPQEQGDWSIKYLELRDPAGNFVQAREPEGRYFPLGEQYMMRRDDGIALVRGAIWPGAWNVHAEFERIATSSVTAAHCWTTSLPLPAIGEKLPLTQTGRVEGCEIQLQSIEGFESRPPKLFLRFFGKDGSYGLRVLGVEDQRGSNIVHLHRYPQLPKNEQTIELRAQPASKQLRITFAVLHPAVVELSGHASILRTNVARWSQKAQ